MQLNRQIQFALLIVAITLALAGATVSTSMGTLSDREAVTVDGIEVDTDESESVTTGDENQSNERATADEKTKRTRRVTAPTSAPTEMRRATTSSHRSRTATRRR